MELSKEMKPTLRTRLARQCVLYQFVRFVTLNLKIVKVALFPPKH